MIIRDPKGNEVDLEIRMVDSSNVDWVGWPKGQNQKPKTGEPMMIVSFKHGGRYAYLGASRQQAVALAHAAANTKLESVGAYLNRVIKPQYEAVKLS